MFGTRQFHGAAVNDITRAAGVAQGTFYVYFKSKQEIFRELVTDLSHRLRTDLATSTRGMPNRLAMERAGIEAFLRFARNHRYLYRIVREAEFVDPDQFQWFYRTMAEGYVRGLSLAGAQGEAAVPHAEALAYCLMGLTDFIGMRWVLWEGQEPPAEVVDAVMQFIEYGLRTPPTP
ncbi:MAG: TetR/AcrR family transcriptional regulator [Mycobacterium leprae]